MKAILFIGLQASGKSSFYKEKLVDDFIRINLDMLNTRRKEQALIEACLQAKIPFVLDNTHASVEQRQGYIKQIKAAGFHLSGYYFSSIYEECLSRNNQRQGKSKIPEVGIKACLSQLERPTLAEGFDQLTFDEIKDDTFVLTPWKTDKEEV